MIGRRRINTWALWATLGGTWALTPRKTQASPARADRWQGQGDPAAKLSQTLAQIERRAQARLGVHVIDTANGAEYGHRADERFLLCSTFKLLASAHVLHRVDQGQEQLDRRITYTRADLVPHSPVTELHVGGDGLSLARLCEGTLTTSDNTAVNLILASLGGPEGLTAFARSIGDSVTRIDRCEPAMSTWRRGDPRDTTSPRAMAHTVQALVLGDVLRPASRHLLQAWMRANTTGERRLKAGLPLTWTVGDKTGTGDVGSTNDIGVLWPPGRAPLVVAAYLTETRRPRARSEAALAEVGRAVAQWLG